jgi:uncharacterized protein YabN with tetrapyrrole methylase and pyrophosphatase domain
MIGRLSVTGLGYRVSGQVTPETISLIRNADWVFYLASDPVSGMWIRELNRNAVSLHHMYEPGMSGPSAIAQMADRVVAPLRDGLEVCAAFYGHPAVFVPIAAAALQQARNEGHEARMYPAISVMDCLFADLGIDPSTSGCQVFEATDFLIRPRQFDTTAKLIILQAGAAGILRYRESLDGNVRGLGALTTLLQARYGSDHEVVIYQMSQLPVMEPRIERVRLGQLADTPISVYATLYVPPLGEPARDGAMMARLGMA